MDLDESFLIDSSESAEDQDFGDLQVSELLSLSDNDFKKQKPDTQRRASYSHV